jgi:SSS family solute:Na+ symporter
MILRFLSARSVDDSRKAATVVVLVLMPIAALVVSGGGWLGRAMVNLDLLSTDTEAKSIFVTVASVLCGPGLFGFVIAALTAALMSTADTLINAVSAIVVTDVWKPYIVRDAADRHYLRVGRAAAICASLAAILLVPVYQRFESVYQAHAAFTAAITPPLVVAVVLGAFWRRYSPTAAFWTIVGGMAAIAVSMGLPKLVVPFSHGVGPEGYRFMRALYGLAVSGAIGVAVSFFTKPRAKDEVAGLICSRSAPTG